MAGFGLHLAIGFSAGLDPAEGLQSWEIMMLCQSLGGNDGAGAGLLAAMPGLLLTGDRMVWQNLAETRPGVGQ